MVYLSQQTSLICSVCITFFAEELTINWVSSLKHGTIILYVQEEIGQQIWVNDMISQDNAENTAVRDIFDEDMQVSDLYGEDPRGPPPNNLESVST